MKDWPEAAGRGQDDANHGMVLVGLGAQGAAGPGGLPPLASVAAQLAGLLQSRLLRLQPRDNPDAALTSLRSQAELATTTWLAPLELDAGLPLADGSCWAMALGAWRQPVLLVIPAVQLSSGVPAAATALLRQWRVPLLGLLQWGGSWQARQRASDGLPWLGVLSDRSPEADGPATAGPQAETAPDAVGAGQAVANPSAVPRPAALAGAVPVALERPVAAEDAALWQEAIEGQQRLLEEDQHGVLVDALALSWRRLADA